MMAATGIDVRSDFPFLNRAVNNKPIIYFDNAATTQKPAVVIDCLRALYESGVSNVHRAVNFLAEEVTQVFEESRQSIAAFIGAHAQEVIFVNNATHGINIICSSLSAQRRLRVLTSTLEHHSNLVPWVKHGQVDLIPWDRSGRLDLDAFHRQLRSSPPDLVAIAQASNFLGTVHPVAKIIEMCRSHRVPVLVDASQSIAHHPVDVRALDCDYLVFSGHKVYGPGGIGVLFIRRERQEQLQPVFVGGAMVKEVHSHDYVVNDLPFRFEPGTPNIEGVIGLGCAVRYLQSVGYEFIGSHERQLTSHARQRIRNVPHVTVFGPDNDSTTAPLVPFQVKALDPGAVAKTLAARANVIVRSGFHCAQPAHEELGIGPTVRVSFGLYNTTAEIDVMIEVLETLVRFLH
jgi:cysteine desulfurase/selenocysteine lyase